VLCDLTRHDGLDKLVVLDHAILVDLDRSDELVDLLVGELLAEAGEDCVFGECIFNKIH